MNRRSFLKTLVGGVAVAAAVRTFPFRVYSFPEQIKIAPVAGVDYYAIEWPAATRVWQFGVYTEEVLRYRVRSAPGSLCESRLVSAIPKD